MGGREDEGDGEVEGEGGVTVRVTLTEHGVELLCIQALHFVLSLHTV